MSHRPVGPAVYGLTRPTIVIPLAPPNPRRCLRISSRPNDSARTSCRRQRRRTRRRRRAFTKQPKSSSGLPTPLASKMRAWHDAILRDSFPAKFNSTRRDATRWIRPQPPSARATIWSWLRLRRYMNASKNWNADSVTVDHDQTPGSSVIQPTLLPWDHESPRVAPLAATSNVEKRLPICCAVLDNDATQRFCSELQAQRTVNMILAPKVTMLDSQSATIQDAAERALVVGCRRGGEQVPTYEPQVRVVREGTTIQLRPTQTGEDQVRVDL